VLRRQFEFGRTGCALEAQRLTDASGRASRWEEKGIGKFKTSQASDVGSIPIARSMTHDDPIGITRPAKLYSAEKWTVLDPSWPPASGVNPLDGTNYLDTASAFVKAFLASSTSSLEGMNTSAKLIFLCGKMAAGKSTLARHLAKRENASR
jgi:hypothetical protein